MFEDRRDAGKRLSRVLKSYTGKDTVVYGLPRGGVIVAYEIAKALRAPLDIVVVRKIGHPHNSEYAIAAIAEGGILVQNKLEVKNTDAEWFKEEVQREEKEMARRRQIYTNGKRLSADGKTAIVVDDGLATGLTMHAALKSVREQNPKKIIVALPVAPAESLAELKKFADEVIGLIADPQFLGAVGAYYEDFQQVSDEEVIATFTSIA